jgi:ankyrin repeat protein
MKESNFNIDATEKLENALLGKRPLQEIATYIHSGANVNGKSEGMETYMILAIESYPDDRIANLLLDSGADPNIPDDTGMTALMHAFEKGVAFLPLARRLLPTIGNISHTDSANRTHLWYAARCAPPDILSALHEKDNSIIDRPDDDGRSPLMHAAEHANWKAVHYFLNLQSLFDRKDLGGKSALMLASAYSMDPKLHKQTWDYPDAQIDTARFLIAAGADVNQTDSEGTTALMWAAYSDSVATARLLYYAGAIIDARDHLGMTALDIAESVRSYNTMAFLKNI